MSEEKTDVSASDGAINHRRNFLIIIGVLAVLYVAFNAFGAVQCVMNGGDIQISGGIGCFMDFSNR